MGIGILKRGIGVMLGAVVAVACSGSSSPSAAGGGGGVDAGGPILIRGDDIVSAADASLDDTTLVSHTAVRVNADGTQDSVTTMITVAQQKANQAARRARDASRAQNQFPLRTNQAAVTVDPYCDDFALWVYNRYNATGAEICFYEGQNIVPGQGPSIMAYLGNYSFLVRNRFGIYVPVSWAGAVQSIWPGSYVNGASPGCFASTPAYNANAQWYQNFGMGDPVTNITQIASTQYLFLDQVCCAGSQFTCSQIQNSTAVAGAWNSTCESTSSAVQNPDGTCCNVGSAESSGLCCPSGTSNSNGICCPPTQVNVGPPPGGGASICCSPGLTNCAGGCVDTQTDANNCGGCGINAPHTGCQAGALCGQAGGATTSGYSGCNFQATTWCCGSSATGGGTASCIQDFRSSSTWGCCPLSPDPHIPYLFDASSGTCCGGPNGYACK